MASNQKAKQSKGTRNDARKSGKSWKGGLSPEDRERQRLDRLARRTPEQKARDEARRLSRIAKEEVRVEKMLRAPVTSDD